MDLYQNLIQDVRLFILDEIAENQVISQNPTPAKIAPPKPIPTEKLQPTPLTPKPLLNEKPTPPPPTHPTFESMRKTMGQIFPELKLTSPKIPILLALFEENSAHRLFLESVARAISQILAPAEVILTKKIPPDCKLLLACLKEMRVEGQVHQLMKLKGISYLPLAPIDAYLADAELKRELWITLKSLSPSSLM